MINNNNGNQNVPSKDYRINGSKVTIHKNNNSISFQFTYQGKRYKFGANLNWYSFKRSHNKFIMIVLSMVLLREKKNIKVINKRRIT